MAWCPTKRRSKPQKLSPEAVADIRTSKLKQKELAAKYGVGVPMISMVLTGRRWRHHETPPAPRYWRTAAEVVW